MASKKGNSKRLATCSRYDKLSEPRNFEWETGMQDTISKLQISDAKQVKERTKQPTRICPPSTNHLT